MAMFLDQFSRFPKPRYDDALDAMARIEQPDMPLCWPVAGERVVGDSYDRAEQEQIDREISGGFRGWGCRSGKSEPSKAGKKTRS